MADLTARTAAEEKLFECLSEGRELKLDLSDRNPVKNDPKNGDSWEAARTVHADFIYELIVTNREGYKKIHPKGLRLKGVKIEGELDLEGAEIKNPIWITNCYFTDQIDLTEARTRTISLNGSYVPNIKAPGLYTKGTLFFSKNKESNFGFEAPEGLDLSGAVIHGDLNCDGGNFVNMEDEEDAHAINAEGIVVKGDALLGNDFQSTGGVSIAGSQIDGSLKCINGIFKNKGSFTKKKNVALLADGSFIKGDVHIGFGFTSHGVIKFNGAEIGGDFDCISGIWEFPDSKGRVLKASGITVKGDVRLDNCKAKGEIYFHGADIGGDLDCERVELENPKGESFNAEASSIKGTLTWLPAPNNNMGAISFAHASADQLKVTPSDWPTNHSVNVDGFIYGSLVEKSLTKSDDWMRWLRVDVNNTTIADKIDFRPQPFEQLTQVLRRMGHNENANDVAMEKQKEIWNSKSIKTRGGKLWHWVMWRANRKGYQPFRILRWYIFPLWLTSSVLFWIAYQNGIMHPSKELVYLNSCYNVSQAGKDCEKQWKGLDPWNTPVYFMSLPAYIFPKPSGVSKFFWKFASHVDGSIQIPKEYPAFSPPAYSADLIIPAFDLHQESYWLPYKEWSSFKVIMWFVISYGWFLTTVFVVGITEFLKRE